MALYKYVYDMSYGQIAMKFYGSIAVGAWTNWIGFQPDLDHSLDSGTGFTPDFSGISQEVMDRFQ